MRYFIYNPTTKEERHIQTLERIPTRKLLCLVDAGQQVYMTERGRTCELHRAPPPFNHTPCWKPTTT